MSLYFIFKEIDLEKQFLLFLDLFCFFFGGGGGGGGGYFYNREKNIKFLHELIISSGNLVVYTHDCLYCIN
jgi:hypothetical protein